MGNLKVRLSRNYGTGKGYQSSIIAMRKIKNGRTHSISECELFDALKKLYANHQTLTLEEEDVIKNIAKRF